MRLEQFTVKAQEAITGAQGIASEHAHQQLEPEHLFVAMLADGDGVAASIIRKIGADLETLRENAQSDRRQAESLRRGNLPRLSFAELEKAVPLGGRRNARLPR
jgi:ATP-dependent Clp protease ATP-binding subunit ClpA